MISKVALWEERDKALKEGLDKQARFGCKGKNKFWYGYKRNVAACMKKQEP